MIAMPTQAPMWEIPAGVKKERATNKDLIRTDSYSNSQILKWISHLYLPNGLDLDCTWNKGFIYRGTGIRPRIRFDINPKSGSGCLAAADFHNLPLRDCSVSSAIFDPPFFANSYGGKLFKQYGGYPRPEPLWDSYQAALAELYRVLKMGGILVMKCQDFICGRKQYLVHADIITYAKSIRLYTKDLFIKIQRHVTIGWNQHNQNHARKTHSYYIVFEKKRRVIRTVERKGQPL